MFDHRSVNNNTNQAQSSSRRWNYARIRDSDQDNARQVDQTASSNCTRWSCQQPTRNLTDKEVNVSAMIESTQKIGRNRQQMEPAFETDFIDQRAVQMNHEQLKQQSNMQNENVQLIFQPNLPIETFNQAEDENLDETAQWEFAATLTISGVSQINQNSTLYQESARGGGGQTHIGPRLEMQNSGMKQKAIDRQQESTEPDIYDRSLIFTEDETEPRVQVGPPNGGQESSSLMLSPTLILNNEPAIESNFQLFRRSQQQLPQNSNHDTFVAKASPGLNALSPTQLRLLEEKLEHSEQKLGPVIHDIHAEKLLIASSSPTHGAKSSDPSGPGSQPAPATNHEIIGAVSQFQLDVRRASRQRENEQTMIAHEQQFLNQAPSCNEKTQPTLDSARHVQKICYSGIGTKSELTVIKSESEGKSSRGMGVIDLKKSISCMQQPNMYVPHKSARQAGLKRVNSRNGLPKTDKIDGQTMRNLSRFIDPHVSQPSTSQRTVDQVNDRLIEARLEQCAPSYQRSSMTQILAPEYLKNIGEEEQYDFSNKQKQSEDFRNLQQIEEAVPRSQNKDLGLGFDENIGDYRSGPILSSSPHEEQTEIKFHNSSTPAAHTPTATMSANGEVHQSALIQNQALFTFPENSQSGSSRPIYYHQSVIDRSNDDENEDGARTGQMYAIPSYSALDKSQSHTRTASMSRSNCLSAKINRHMAQKESQNHEQLKPQSLNGSSRHSVNETDGFGLVLSSEEHSIQKLTQHMVQRSSGFDSQQQHSRKIQHNPVKSIVFEEVSDRGEKGREGRDSNIINVTSDSKEATGPAANSGNINEFLTFAKKLSKSSNQAQQLINHQQKLCQKAPVVPDRLEAKAAVIQFSCLGAQECHMRQSIDLVVTEQEESIEDKCFKETQDAQKRSMHNIRIQSNFCLPPEPELQIDASDQRQLSTHEDKSPMPDRNALQHKSSSKVNSVYLNNANGSHSVQSSHRMIDDGSSSQSLPKTDIATISGNQLLAMCTGIDALQMEQTPVAAANKSNEMSNSWHTFNQKQEKMKNSSVYDDEPYVNSAISFPNPDPFQNLTEAHSFDEALVPLNKDLPTSPPQERFQDQTLYEASCSRNLKNSALSLYTDSEAALKCQWEQHQRNQQKLRNKKFKNLNFSMKLSRQSTSDIQKTPITGLKISKNSSSIANQSQKLLKGLGYRNSGSGIIPAESSDAVVVASSHTTTIKLSNNIIISGAMLKERSQLISSLSTNMLNKGALVRNQNHRVFARNDQWQQRVKKKQEELRSEKERADNKKELQECYFKPTVIGYQYDNSGLSKSQKLYYRMDSKDASQSKERPVEQRCHLWLQNKEKNLLKKEQQVKQRQEKECTFRPNIGSSRTSLEPRKMQPAMQRDISREFIERQAQWAQNVSNKKSWRKQAIERQQASESTFQPNIGRASQKIWSRRKVSPNQAEQVGRPDPRHGKTASQPRNTAVTPRQATYVASQKSGISRKPAATPRHMEMTPRQMISSPRYQVNIYVDKLVGVPLKVKNVAQQKKTTKRNNSQKPPKLLDKQRCKSTGSLPRRVSCRELTDRYSIADSSIHKQWQYPAAKRPPLAQNQDLGHPEMIKQPQHCEHPVSQKDLNHNGCTPYQLVEHKPIFGFRGSLTERQGERDGPDVLKKIQILDPKESSDNLQNGLQSTVSFSLQLNKLSQSQNTTNVSNTHLPPQSEMAAQQQQQKKDKPIPGRIYKQGQSASSQDLKASAAAPPSAKPAYYTEASKQITEAIAHLQRINERYKATVMNKASLAEDAPNDLSSYEQCPTATTRNQVEKLEQMTQTDDNGMLAGNGHEKEADTQHHSNISQVSSKTTSKLQKLRRDSDRQNQKVYQPQMQAALHLRNYQVKQELENNHVQRIVGQGKIGQIIEQKQQIIRNLRNKQKQQGVMILRGVLKDGLKIQ